MSMPSTVTAFLLKKKKSISVFMTMFSCSAAVEGLYLKDIYLTNVIL